MKYRAKDFIKECDFGGGIGAKDGTFGNSFGLTPKGSKEQGKVRGNTQEAPIHEGRRLHQNSL